MQTITLVLATPGKFAKKTVETNSVATLRGIAAEMAARAPAEVRLIWRGQLLQDTCKIDTVSNNSLVTIGRIGISLKTYWIIMNIRYCVL